MRASLDYARLPTAAERWVQNALAWDAPRLPAARRTRVPRWSAGPTWTPPGTIMLVRHRALDGSGRVVTNDRNPPPGFEIEFDLGLVHQFSQPGTARLLADAQTFFCTRFEGGLDDEVSALGYVEQAPLPMLDALEVRRDVVTGQHVLVAGAADPLFATAEPVGTVGFLDGYPINPRQAHDVRVEPDLVSLLRVADTGAWRHEYRTGERDDEGVALGGVWRTRRPLTAELRIEADGTLSSELLAGRRAQRDPRAALRWAGAPLAWASPWPRRWAVRASASRARQLTRELPGAGVAGGGAARVLGYARSEPAPGWSPLFAAHHPVLGDQYLTRSEIEASDLGYVVDGLIGYVADRRADAGAEVLAPELKWASHFGQQRRYFEGAWRG